MNRTYSPIQNKNLEAAASRGNASQNSISLIDNRPHPVQMKPNNTGLPDSLKSGIEQLSGHSLNDVKVHYNSSQPAQLNAYAYAQGNQIHVAPGQEKHLPHEAWHVVQQKQGRVRPTMQMKGKVNINNDTSLEKEADVMGMKALGIIQRYNTVDSNLFVSNRSVCKATLPQVPFVLQRVVIPLATGGPWSYQIDAADLGTGTHTTPATRLGALAAAPGPPALNWSYTTWNPATMVPGPANHGITLNPAPAGGANWHAGHTLARQNGGRGDLNTWIVPQNPTVNMGHAGTYGLWRAHEVAFHNAVYAMGRGQWNVA